jgi:hypothetical protein
MRDVRALALESTQRVRASAGARALPQAERAALERDLARLEAAFAYGTGAAADPYAATLDSPVERFQQQLAGGGAQPAQPTAPANPQPAPAPSPPSSVALDPFGRRTAEALEAIDFPKFVAGLVTGTFQAIVDASAQQIREYARLVESLSQTLEDFSRENVTANQARDALAERHAADLQLELPRPGSNAQPRILPRRDKQGTSPQWLAKYGLAGESLTVELTEGALLTAARTQVGEDKLQALATMVLMGINRIVVNDGEIKARLIFHATAQEKTRAEVQQLAGQQQGGIAAQTIGGGASAMMAVSTLKANAQADAAMRADLMGEVRISFRSETFPLERFADSAAIQLINRHARTPATTPPAPTAAPVAPATAPAAAPATTPAAPAAPNGGAR